ncbi:MAG TPA: hypothetical protein VLG28_05815 [Acidimicrobiia bacterium]|jgi:hypothetical protein|nr:hypothetical protein [Acidimicrobiia bacterium]
MLNRAIEVQDVLADRSQQRGAEIAGVTGQPVEWVVPAGATS